MAKIIIDIDDNLYTRLFDNGVDNYDDAIDMAKAIRKGIPLPKGHGRLVDADEMVKILRKSEYYQEKRGDFYGADVTSRVKNFIEDTETVIEADKEVEHESYSF